MTNMRRTYGGKMDGSQPWWLATLVLQPLSARPLAFMLTASVFAVAACSAETPSGPEIGQQSRAPTSFPNPNSILDNFNRPDQGPPPSASWSNEYGEAGLKVISNQLAAS